MTDNPQTRTLYLTQACVSAATVARHGLRTLYNWHQAVWDAFPNQAAEPRTFLTRLDESVSGFRLIISSLKAPTCPRWIARERDSWQTQLIPAEYFQHQRYAFQLTANPTKKVRAPLVDGRARRNGRRMPLRQPEELAHWLERKAAQGGFSIDLNQTQMIPRGPMVSFKKDHACTHSAVDFRGHLSVIDRPKFLAAFIQGIGSAKAFGFGLLLLKPL
jgi:CRISPR system Cascade subunit CasE